MDPPQSQQCSQHRKIFGIDNSFQNKNTFLKGNNSAILHIQLSLVQTQKKVLFSQQQTSLKRSPGLHSCFF